MPSAVNLPNALSFGRILAVPALVVCVLAAPGQASLLAASIFVAAAITDCIDGYVARRRSLVTDLGKLLDPLADKLLVGATLLSLVAVGRVAAWAVAIILAREVMVSVLRSATARDGTAMAARPLGKVKMGLQTALILALLAVPDAGHAGVLALLYATVGVTVVSGLDMAAAATRMRRLRPRPRIAAS